jgi:hypothetical protein
MALNLLLEKSIFLFMIFLYSILTAFIFNFTSVNEIPYSALETAFTANNATEIVTLGKDKILLNILGNEGAYSHSQATLVLKDFFNKKAGTSFKFIFKGKETAEGSFAIGTYASKTEVFRITIQFKKILSDFKIESLTIEKA